MRFAFCCIFFFFHHFLLAADYNIVDFGAAADGETLNTKSIQAAIDAAAEAGGGRAVVPRGKFLTGTVLLKSGVELHLREGAVLLGSTNPADYTTLHNWEALIMAESRQNIAITGTGEIDGQGRRLALNIDSLFYAGQLDSADYDVAEKRPHAFARPLIIWFFDCKNITVKNVTLKNAASWVQAHNRCENILIDSVRTESDAYWNNDGLDIIDCRTARVLHCFSNAADDGLCLKSHSAELGCDNIHIADCTVRSSASAVKLGTQSNGGFRNVTIENIRVYDTFRSALAIECVDGGALENVTVSNVQAVNTGNAIFIRLGERKAGSVLKNVTVKNMKVEVAFGRPDGAYEIRGPELPFFHNTFPSSITGIPGRHVENVTLENIEIIYPGRGNNGLANMPLSRLDAVPEKAADYPEFSMFGELPAWGFYVRHVSGLSMKNIRLSIKAPDYRPALVFDDVRNLHIEAMQVSGDDKPAQIVLHNTAEVSIDSERGVLKK